MTHLLRHFTIRLWGSLLIGGLIVLLGFPFLGETIGLTVAFWAVLVCFVIFFFFGRLVRQYPWYAWGEPIDA